MIRSGLSRSEAFLRMGADPAMTAESSGTATETAPRTPSLRLDLERLGLASRSRFRCFFTALIAVAFQWYLINGLEPLLEMSFSGARLVIIAVAAGVIGLAAAAGELSWARMGVIREDVGRQILNGVIWIGVATFFMATGAVLLIFFARSGRAIESPIGLGDFETLGQAMWVLGLGGLAEELMFRGVVLPQLWRATGSAVIAALISSAVFAWLHGPGGVGVVVATFFFSLALSILFVRGGGLIPATTCHALGNVLRVAVLAVVSKG